MIYRYIIINYYIMNLIETHEHKLIFKIDKDAPKEYMKRWKDFKLKCENGENEHIVEQIKEYCKLEKNKSLPYLKRTEGGLGGDNNLIDKQIRFRHIFKGKCFNDVCIREDNSIIFIISNYKELTEQDKWTYQELDDLIYAFTKVANNYVRAECVNGYIIMRNYDSLCDGYLDSDSE